MKWLIITFPHVEFKFNEQNVTNACMNYYIGVLKQLAIICPLNKMPFMINKCYKYDIVAPIEYFIRHYEISNVDGIQIKEKYIDRLTNDIERINCTTTKSARSCLD